MSRKRAANWYNHKCKKGTRLQLASRHQSEQTSIGILMPTTWYRKLSATNLHENSVMSEEDKTLTMNGFVGGKTHAV
eukprot:6462235-Amphidinium_carterae.1